MSSAKKKISEGGMTVVYSTDFADKIGGKNIYFRHGEDLPGVPTVTGRDLSLYHRFLAELLKNDCSGIRMMEIGAGLGEAPIRFSEAGADVVIVDYFDPALCSYLLEQIEPHVKERHLPQLDCLFERAQFIQEDPRITHLQMTLEEALLVPELYHTADILIDNFGPQYWDRGVKYRGKLLSPNQAEAYFVKDGGHIVPLFNSNPSIVNDGDLVEMKLPMTLMDRVMQIVTGLRQ